MILNFLAQVRTSPQHSVASMRSKHRRKRARKRKMQRRYSGPFLCLYATDAYQPCVACGCFAVFAGHTDECCWKQNGTPCLFYTYHRHPQRHYHLFIEDHLWLKCEYTCKRLASIYQSGQRAVCSQDLATLCRMVDLDTSPSYLQNQRSNIIILR